MAIYHNHLQYHDDTVKKHTITKEEVEFLLSLQKEMNTQDTVAQADPRFWVIKGTEKVWDVSDDNADGSAMFRYGTEVAINMEEACDYINDNLLEEINKGEVVRTFKIVPKSSGNCIAVSVDNNRREVLGDLFEVVSWLDKHGYDEFRCYHYAIQDKIYPNTMFLTQKSGEDHLRANHYHYSSDAHTYAMTSWRCKETEMLWKIIQEVDWQQLGKDL